MMLNSVFQAPRAVISASQNDSTYCRDVVLDGNFLISLSKLPCFELLKKIAVETQKDRNSRYLTRIERATRELGISHLVLFKDETNTVNNDTVVYVCKLYVSNTLISVGRSCKDDNIARRQAAHLSRDIFRYITDLPYETLDDLKTMSSYKKPQIMFFQELGNRLKMLGDVPTGCQGAHHTKLHKVLINMKSVEKPVYFLVREEWDGLTRIDFCNIVIKNVLISEGEGWGSKKKAEDNATVIAVNNLIRFAEFANSPPLADIKIELTTTSHSESLESGNVSVKAEICDESLEENYFMDSRSSLKRKFKVEDTEIDPRNQLEDAQESVQLHKKKCQGERDQTAERSADGPFSNEPSSSQRTSNSSFSSGRYFDNCDDDSSNIRHFESHYDQRPSQPVHLGGKSDILSFHQGRMVFDGRFLVALTKFDGYNILERIASRIASYKRGMEFFADFEMAIKDLGIGRQIYLTHERDTGRRNFNLSKLCIGNTIVSIGKSWSDLAARKTAVRFLQGIFTNNFMHLPYKTLDDLKTELQSSNETSQIIFFKELGRRIQQKNYIADPVKVLGNALGKRKLIYFHSQGQWDPLDAKVQYYVIVVDNVAIGEGNHEGKGKAVTKSAKNNAAMNAVVRLTEFAEFADSIAKKEAFSIKSEPTESFSSAIGFGY